MKTIKVLPNPWAAVDQFGLPCGVCPRDPDADAGGPGQYVGARVDPKQTEILQKLEKHEMRSARQKTVFSFMGRPANDPGLAEHLLNAEPIEIPLTNYYRDRIREGAIVCRTQKDAQLARFANFVRPELLFPKPAEAPKPAESPKPDAEPNPDAASESEGASSLETERSNDSAKDADQTTTRASRRNR